MIFEVPQMTGVNVQETQTSEGGSRAGKSRVTLGRQIFSDGELGEMRTLTGWVD